MEEGTQLDLFFHYFRGDIHFELEEGSLRGLCVGSGV
jgi:hypothetical protein